MCKFMFVDKKGDEDRRQSGDASGTKLSMRKLEVEAISLKRSMVQFMKGPKIER